MQRDICAYIQDVLSAAASISSFTAGLEYEAYASSEIVVAAVMYKFEVIGEALKQASRYFPGALEEIPDVKDAIALRDRIAHGYFTIDQKILWRSLKEDIPRLVEHLEKLKAVTCD